MTRDEILALPAGRKLDALVAEKVMGYANRVIWYGKGTASACPIVDGAFPTRVPDYSTDIAAAWLVVERMKMHFTEWHLSRGPRGYSFLLADNITRWSVEGPICQTAAEAICRAALLALEGSRQ